MNFKPLTEPVALTEQTWPEDTIPLVQTSTLAYNHEKYIRKCLDGILMQKTTFPVEVLVHDDASTDATADILREYEAKYPNIMKVIYQEENQYSQPLRGKMRTEMHAARRGKYIAQCEGDDYWNDPEKLQLQVDFLESHPDYAMSSHEVETVWLDGIEQKTIFVEPLESAGFEEILAHGLYMPMPSIVYLSEAHPRDLDWRYKLWAGHWPMIMLITSHGKNYHFSRSMAVKQRNAGGITQNPEHRKMVRKKKLKQKIFLYKRLDQYSEYKYHRALTDAISRVYRRRCSRALKSWNIIAAPLWLFLYLWYGLKSLLIR